MTVLVALIYLQQSASNSNENASTESTSEARGYAALNARLIETGDDGHPLYQLTAKRIEQPLADGEIEMVAPHLVYQPDHGSAWQLTAQHGRLPQDAHSADLDGNVHAEGQPAGSKSLLQLDTQRLHLDMQQQLATSADEVHVLWSGSSLKGRGLRADLRSGRLQLQAKVSGVSSDKY